MAVQFRVEAALDHSLISCAPPCLTWSECRNLDIPQLSIGHLFFWDYLEFISFVLTNGLTLPFAETTPARKWRLVMSKSKQVPKSNPWYSKDTVPPAIIAGIAVVMAALIPASVMLYKEWKSESADASAIPPANSRPLDDAGEPLILVDNATVSLDLTKNWKELVEKQRKEVKASKATLYGTFVARKLNQDAKFGHRLGTTSRFSPEWRSSDHNSTLICCILTSVKKR
jgi:hypothetical protein